MTHPRLLVVDDDEMGRRSTVKALRQRLYEVDDAPDGEVALKAIAERAPALVLTDLSMPRMGGLELLQRTKSAYPETAMVVVTAADDLTSAVAAMRAGAEDYLTKPVAIDALYLCVERSLARRALLAEADGLRRQLLARDGEALEGLIGASSPMLRVYQRVRQVAPSRATILIRGERGTGKGELARVIHGLSGREHGPFVTLHCPTLLGLEAASEPHGLRGGTLHLDEVGDASLEAQLQLLGLLELHAPCGSEALDVRVVASTSKDLERELREHRFREDLYYRLNVVKIDLPPLRDRGGDILLLAQQFIARYGRENQRRLEGLTEGARQMLLHHSWPGNVRELKNAMEHAALVTTSAQISPESLPFQATIPSFEGIRIPGSTLDEIERYAVTKTLEATEGSTARAAEILDVSVRKIQYRAQEYGIAPRRG